MHSKKKRMQKNERSASLFLQSKKMSKKKLLHNVDGTAPLFFAFFALRSSSIHVVEERCKKKRSGADGLFFCVRSFHFAFFLHLPNYPSGRRVEADRLFFAFFAPFFLLCKKMSGPHHQDKVQVERCKK